MAIVQIFQYLGRKLLINIGYLKIRSGLLMILSLVTLFTVNLTNISCFPGFYCILEPVNHLSAKTILAFWRGWDDNRKAKSRLDDPDFLGSNMNYSAIFLLWFEQGWCDYIKTWLPGGMLAPALFPSNYYPL